MNSTNISDKLPTNVLKPIDELFQQGSYKYDNYYVLLAAAMLINNEDPKRTKDLTNACMREPQRFQWLRLRNKGTQNDKNTLVHCLRYIKSNYEVQKSKELIHRKSTTT